jgi:hypothetical protein
MLYSYVIKIKLNALFSMLFLIIILSLSCFILKHCFANESYTNKLVIPIFVLFLILNIIGLF